MAEPSRVLFVDVETTGLHSRDRVVSLGMFELDMVALRTGTFSAAGTYLVFDPGRKSHPRLVRHCMSLFSVDLTGQSAIVTGAGIGIGRAIALALASAGRITKARMLSCPVCRGRSRWAVK